jgi:hypothetical protein
MFWQTVNFFRLIQLLLPTFLRKHETTLFLNVILTPLSKIADETLYKMQHDGRTIYLEKMLNEHFGVLGYDHQNHDLTKKVYIEDLPEFPKLYIYQPEEEEVSFFEDDDSDMDMFLDNDEEGNISYSWIIYIPDTISFQEASLRALVDSYRYFGKRYKIEIYTL